jgi:hypothetical protein
MTTVLQTRRRRRSTQVAPAEPHALQRRASARFHPLSQSHVFGLVDLEKDYRGGGATAAASGSDVLHHASTPKTQRLQLQGYTIEGGWTIGHDGRATYVEHGRIEEIHDDDDDENNKNENDNDDDTDDSDDDDNDQDDIIDEHNSFFMNPMNELQDSDMATPRLLSSLSHSNLALRPVRAEATGKGLNGFEITEPLPPSATPPPCPPRLRRIRPQLFPSAPSSAIGLMGPQRPSSSAVQPAPLAKMLPPPVANGHAIQGPFRNQTNISDVPTTPNSSMPAKPTKAPTPAKQQQQQQPPQKKMLDIATEVTLLDENSDLLLTVFRDMQILHTVRPPSTPGNVFDRTEQFIDAHIQLFFAQNPVENYTEHINCCTAIEQPVNRIIEVLNTRRRLGEEEWNVKTERWHQKYAQRLYSLRRCVCFSEHEGRKEKRMLMELLLLLLIERSSAYATSE